MLETLKRKLNFRILHYALQYHALQLACNYMEYIQTLASFIWISGRNSTGKLFSTWEDTVIVSHILSFSVLHTQNGINKYHRKHESVSIKKTIVHCKIKSCKFLLWVKLLKIQNKNAILNTIAFCKLDVGQETLTIKAISRLVPYFHLWKLQGQAKRKWETKFSWTSCFPFTQLSFPRFFLLPVCYYFFLWWSVASAILKFIEHFSISRKTD